MQLTNDGTIKRGKDLQPLERGSMPYEIVVEKQRIEALPHHVAAKRRSMPLSAVDDVPAGFQLGSGGDLPPP